MAEKVVRLRERPKARPDRRRGPRRDRPTAVEVVDTLRQRIARQEIPPGSKLREHDLADEFGVPRTRIREVFGTRLGSEAEGQSVAELTRTLSPIHQPRA